MEDALPKEYKEALLLYRKSQNPLNIMDVELRTWQQQLLDKIKSPTEREVIWIRGVRGNEGKTWFQKYLQSLFGYSRVAILDLKNKTANVLHAVRKFQLSTVDIFCFNDARSINHETCCYSVLEHIKDGSAIASKFNSERIQFRTPNIVVVFSNNEPDVKQLSKDRWAIFNATQKGLTDQTERLWKNKYVSPCERIQDPDEKKREFNTKLLQSQGFTIHQAEVTSVLRYNYRE